ncbi:unnamed protein product, partial [Ectocarpus sp. 12 AP-2014]
FRLLELHLFLLVANPVSGAVVCLPGGDRRWTRDSLHGELSIYCKLLPCKFLSADYPGGRLEGVVSFFIMGFGQCALVLVMISVSLLFAHKAALVGGKHGLLCVHP